MSTNLAVLAWTLTCFTSWTSTTEVGCKIQRNRRVFFGTFMFLKRPSTWCCVYFTLYKRLYHWEEVFSRASLHHFLVPLLTLYLFLSSLSPSLCFTFFLLLRQYLLLSPSSVIFNSPHVTFLSLLFYINCGDNVPGSLSSCLNFLKKFLILRNLHKETDILRIISSYIINHF